jgi:hypothetical protein
MEHKTVGDVNNLPHDRLATILIPFDSRRKQSLPGGIREDATGQAPMLDRDVIYCRALAALAHR